jgi:hypothetical protein
MRTSVREYVRECLVCAKNKPGGHGKQHKLVQFQVGAKFELIGMDLVGPLPLTDSKNRYLLTVTDYWTRWCEAYPIPNKESKTVANAFMTRWVTQHGTPLSILTDQGKEFVSELFHECCILMDTWKMRTTPFHPRCNGLTERLNQTVERMLSAFVSENQRDWDTKIPFVMMAYRSAIQETTGITPYAMLYGEEMHVPLDWVFKKPKRVPDDKFTYVKELRKKINSAYEHARKCLLTAIKRQKRNYDKGVKNITFKPGDFVMCHDKTRKRGRNPALRPKWKGPYIILDKLNSATVIIRMSEETKQSVVHVDRLKHCFPPKRSKFRWAEKLIKDSHPDIEINFRDEGDASTEEEKQPCWEAFRDLSKMGELNSNMSEGSGFSSLQDTESGSESKSTGKESGIEKAGNITAKSKIFKTAAQRNMTRTQVSGDINSSDETDVEARIKNNIKKTPYKLRNKLDLAKPPPSRSRFK